MTNISQNRISYAMSVEELEAVRTDIKSIAAKLSFMVALSKDDTLNLYSMSDADKTFVRNALTEMQSVPTLLPEYVNAEEIKTDLACGDQLLEIENKLTALLTIVKRNRSLAYYEAYNSAAVFYKLMGAAGKQGIMDAQTTYERLQSYHRNKKNGGRKSALNRGKTESALGNN